MRRFAYWKVPLVSWGKPSRPRPNSGLSPVWPCGSRGSPRCGGDGGRRGSASRRPPRASRKSLDPKRKFLASRRRRRPDLREERYADDLVGREQLGAWRGSPGCRELGRSSSGRRRRCGRSRQTSVAGKSPTPHTTGTERPTSQTVQESVVELEGALEGVVHEVIGAVAVVQRHHQSGRSRGRGRGSNRRRRARRRRSPRRSPWSRWPGERGADPCRRRCLQRRDRCFARAPRGHGRGPRWPRRRRPGTRGERSGASSEPASGPLAWSPFAPSWLPLQIAEAKELGQQSTGNILPLPGQTSVNGNPSAFRLRGEEDRGFDPSDGGDRALRLLPPRPTNVSA